MNLRICKLGKMQIQKWLAHSHNHFLESCRVLHHKLLEELHALALAWLVVAIIVTVDTDLCATLLAHWWRGLEDLIWLLDRVGPSLRIVILKAVEGLPSADETSGLRIGPHVVGPEDEVVELHRLAALARAVVLDPLNVDNLTAEVLRRLKGVVTVDVRLAWWVLAVAAGRIRANALVDRPEVVLNPHAVVLLQNDGGRVWKGREWTLVVDGVLDARSLALNVVVLHRGIFASIAELLDGVVLREEAEAERVRLPADECVRVAALLAILAANSELLGVDRRRHSRHVHILSLRNDLARRQVNILVLVAPGAPSDALAELAARHLILVAAAETVPAMRIAIIWASGFLQCIWHRGAWHPLIVGFLGGVAPVARVLLVHEEAHVRLVGVARVSASLYLALWE